LIAEIFFENFECDGIVMAEETYKDLEMVGTTEGTLRIFLHSDYSESLEDLQYDVENILDISREEFLKRGLTDEELGSWEFSLEEKKAEDWSKKWKEQWTVTHVTDKIAVVPDWIEYSPQQDEIMIKLEPGCAFGTGTHQTTQLCMKALEKYMKSGDRVADIGMGSGILSILAKKLGASYVYGCDTDDTVIDVAKENAVKNDVEAVFELGSADKIKDKFDFVVANILHFVLAEIMPDLKKIMKHGATMSLSGILDEKRQIVIEAYEKAGLELVEEIKQDQWTSFVVRRGND
jgi:ribosomal protein L11 methyltransferase